MFPNFGKRVDSGFIKNGGGFLKGPMQHLPWGDKVLLEKAFLIFSDGSRKHQLLLPGVIFRPNHDLERRTKGASTHLIYHDAYEAQRGAEHAVRNYGVRKGRDEHGLKPEPGTEVADLKSDVRTLREYVVFLLRMGPHFEHVLRDLHLGMNELAVRYGWKIDEDKKKAAEQMIRGLIEKDSLGRKNIPAAAMSMGGAIWHLLEREEVVQWLSMHMDQKAIQTERLIAEHMELFQRIWTVIGSQAAVVTVLCNMAHENITLQGRLNTFADTMESVRARPFIKNTKHTARDIRVLEKCLAGHVSSCRRDSEIQACAARLREGIRWVFVLDALQRGIIFPLSHLIEDLLRAERVKRRRTKEKGRIIITSDLAPEKFADLTDRIAGFNAKLAKCKDDVLVHPVKSEVLALLAVAQSHLAEDDWRLVKLDLDAITDIL